MALAVVGPIADQLMISKLLTKSGALGQLLDNFTELGAVFVLLFNPFIIFFELVGVKNVQESSS